VYSSDFTNLYYGTYDLAAEEKPRTAMKLVTLLPEERVLGVHMIGRFGAHVLALLCMQAELFPASTVVLWLPRA
jgi:pyruvate/2-oxoglutarate dehydrogenase complex dihydrolipoamide dehydrogenase (E3) component